MANDRIAIVDGIKMTDGLTILDSSKDLTISDITITNGATANVYLKCTSSTGLAAWSSIDSSVYNQTLAQVSANSATSSEQAITIKSGTNLTIKDSGSIDIIRITSSSRETEIIGDVRITNGGKLRLSSSDNIYIANSSEAISFITNSSERLSIDSAGRIIAGSTDYINVIDSSNVLTNKQYVDNAISTLSAVYQPLNADLSAIASLSGIGIAVLSSADQWTVRTISSGNGISIIAGNGSSANPTISAENASYAARGIAMFSTRDFILDSSSVSLIQDISTAGTPQLTNITLTSTAPMTIASTTMVTNLNAEFLGGIPSTGYAPINHVHSSEGITGFDELVDDRVASLLSSGAGMSLTYNDVANSLTIATNQDISTSATPSFGRVTINSTGKIILNSTVVGQNLLLESAGYTANIVGTYNLYVQSGYDITLKTGANQNIDLSAGGLIQIRDRDSSDTVRMTINSSNGNVDITGDSTINGSLVLDGRTIHTPSVQAINYSSQAIQPNATYIKITSSTNVVSTGQVIAPGVEGQVLYLVYDDGDLSHTLTITSTNSSASQSLVVMNSSDYVMRYRNTLTLIYSGARWLELSRSVNDL